MIRSMTGFGSASGRVGRSRVAVELRTVNHRFFNPSIKLAPSLARWEGEVRDLLKRSIARGHVTLVAKSERDVDALRIDERRFESYVQQLRTLQERHALGAAIDVSAVLRLPEVIGSSDDEAEGTAEELLAVVGQAMQQLMRMRESEGQTLRTLLVSRLDVLTERFNRIAERAPERLVAERDRMRKGAKELADGIDVDQTRLAQEIALLADRLDVSEEVDRFRSHLSAFRESLAGNGRDPVGKRLSFLLQEMLRETNTTGSKSRDAAMLHEVVAVKEELERIAEQVENLE